MYDNILRHKVFVSFHHDDQIFKDMFVGMMEGYIVDKSVEDGDIDDNLKVDTIRRKIRDDFIRDATVTVVLIGPCMWQRKHVDWEIGSSLRATKTNPRCGLLGILLPNHKDNRTGKFHHNLIPPRLADNCGEEDSYATICDWTSSLSDIRNLIHSAFCRRNGGPPDNSRPQFARNRSEDCSLGWTD